MTAQSAKIESNGRKVIGGVHVNAAEELRRRFAKAKGVTSLKDLVAVKYDGPEVSGKI